MDMKAMTEKLTGWGKKYRYPLLVLAIGLALLLIPTGKTENTGSPAPTQAAQSIDMTRELTAILSQIQGVGKVQVLLTVATGEQTIYHSDENSTDTSVRLETVIITDSQRNEQALVDQVLPPTYRGAIVVCQGADSAAVKLAIVEAVSRATGLGADSISVLKMK